MYGSNTITLQDWSVNYVRKLKCQPCMEAAQLANPQTRSQEGASAQSMMFKRLSIIT